MKHGIFIVLAGEIGAGKTTAAAHLSGHYNVSHKSFVDTLWKPILLERGLPVTRANLQELGVELMGAWGARGIVDRMFDTLADNANYVLDDVRSPEVYEYIRSLAPQSSLVFLETSFTARFPRLVTRDSVSSESEQRQAEKASTETSIRALKPYADHVISNDGDLVTFHAALDDVAKNLDLVAR